jgi:ubiquinone/menaquinone biosynthesis C-methylase UbiE
MPLSSGKLERGMDELQQIKEQVWFYEFPLPDGTKTRSYLAPEVVRIHTTREKALREYLAVTDRPGKTALDIACHEGFYTLVLAEYFAKVVGIDKNEHSLTSARKMGLFLKKSNISFQYLSVEEAPENLKSDFVLCYGLIYHVENPLQILRKLANMTIKTLCIETQILPFSISYRVEDGSYMNMRDMKGMFALCPDYPSSKEGGITEFALVPSQDAVIYLLKNFGFSKISLYTPVQGDYEQFVRGSRIILFAEK